MTRRRNNATQRGNRHKLARPRHASVSGPQSRDAATHRRTHDTALRLAPDGETHQSRGSCGARSSARTRRSFLEQPRIHGLPAEPDIVERQRAQAQLGDEHRTRVVETLHYRGVLRGDAGPESFGAVRRGNSSSIEKVFTAPRDAVQRPAVLARGNFLIGFFGLLERQLARQRDHAAQLGIESLQSPEIKLGKALGTDFSLLDPAGKLRHRGECNVFVL